MQQNVDTPPEMRQNEILDNMKQNEKVATPRDATGNTQRESTEHEIGGTATQCDSMQQNIIQRNSI